MIKGFNRRVVVMKNTGSDMFDEAYFIVKENFFGRGKSGRSAVDEAKQIVKSLSEKDRKSSPFDFVKNRFFLFSLGGILGFFIEKLFF
ncbi:MAG: hypothetical protein E7582_00410 [Ruminococcaceae bacterium]|nr:hypothetical protein [Oscillospiraceae bacterium]